MQATGSFVQAWAWWIPRVTTWSTSDGKDTIKVLVDSGTSVVLSGTYMFTRNWAFDILAAYPFTHDIKLDVNGDSAKIAETDHLPPTFSVQYHFIPDGKFQPYAGIGFNWTTFFNTDTVSELSEQGINLELDDSFGVAAQLGADWLLNDSWLLNFDLRWINIETDAKLAGESARHGRDRPVGIQHQRGLSLLDSPDE